ncbi:MAG: tetratricopeptide repeat protein [Candidatus Omnitrophica bacterium]|nr:tetratricopeptide repeat protein [Candidatus Omnitrophota bacterium]
MESLKTHKRARPSVRRGIKFAPVVAHSAAKRLIDHFTNAYQKTFVSSEDVRPDFYKERGFEYFTKGDFIKSRDSFFNYIDHAGDRDPGVLYMLAMCFKNMDKEKEAADFLKKAEGVAKNDPDIIRALGECLYNIEEYPEAIEFLLKAIRFCSVNPGIYYQLGVSYEKISRPREAETFYKKAIALDPTRSEYHQTLGFLYKAEERHKESIACLRNALHAEWRQKRGGGSPSFRNDEHSAAT